MATDTDTDTDTTEPITKPKTAKAAPANKAKATTKADADPEPEDGPAMLSRRKLFGAVAAMGAGLYEVYRHVGVFRAGGRGFLGIVAGFLILAAILYVVSLVLVHILHVHHRAIGSWLVRAAGHGLAWAGRRGERLLASGYDYLVALVAPLIIAVGAWAGPRWLRRHDPDDDDPDDDPETGVTDPAGEGPAGSAEAPAPADESKDGVPVTTSTEPSYRGGQLAQTMAADRPARRAGSRFGGRRTFPEAKPLINLVDDANPSDGDEIDHHDLQLGLAATLYDLAQAWSSYCGRCAAPTVRLGKGAMEAANALAETLVTAAEGAAEASKGFEDYYDGINEEVAGGKELPKDGDFLTGQGAGG
jgi:hypothetical protein